MSRALRGTLISYNGHIIDQVHIREQNQVIRVKNLHIFEDYKSKVATDLLDYKNGALIF